MELSVTIDVAASPERVWEVLTEAAGDEPQCRA